METHTGNQNRFLERMTTFGNSNNDVCKWKKPVKNKVAELALVKYDNVNSAKWSLTLILGVYYWGISSSRSSSTSKRNNLKKTNPPSLQIQKPTLSSPPQPNQNNQDLQRQSNTQHYIRQISLKWRRSTEVHIFRG